MTRSLGYPFQDSQGVFVGIEMPHPGEKRIAVDLQCAPCRPQVAHFEAARGLGGLIYARRRLHQPGSHEGLRLSYGAEGDARRRREGSSPRGPTPEARHTIRMVLQ